MANRSFEPSAADLYDAICADSLKLVKSYLEAGVDPNASLAGIVPCMEDIDVDSLPHHLILARNTRDGLPPTLLHVAVIYCHQNFHTSIDGDEDCPALQMVDQLLAKGADTGAASSALTLEGKSTCSDKTPIGLAVFLKKELRYNYKSAREILDKVILKLEDASVNAGQRQPATVPVLKSVAKAYKKLLLSWKFSDVKFVCPDGQVLPAHRCILAAASPYFETALDGPWAENNNNGNWKTSHSSQVMKTVLTLIYRGLKPSNILEHEPIELLAVASEFDLDSLKSLAENSCIRSLKKETVKDLLLAAMLYENNVLKGACFDLVKRNAAAVLTNPDIMELTTENPALWAELTKAIAPGNKENEGPNRSSKRAKSK